jgi:tRNA (guanine-N7-)-methyltransferase
VEREDEGKQQELLRPEDLPRVLRHQARRLEVEIGCGNGHFMVEYCRSHPWSLFIGVEIKKKRCLKAKKKIERSGLANARIVYGSAEEVLSRLADGSVDGFHLYFPDPWPKSRHRRRRFLRRENIEILKRKLKVGGRIFIVTDFFDYYLHTKVLFLLQGGFRPSRLEAEESVFLSMYGRRITQTGKQIRRLTFERTGDRRHIPLNG